MKSAVQLQRRLGWIFLAIAVNIVVIGTGALWMTAGLAGLMALFQPSNLWIWIAILATFAPAIASFYTAHLLRRRGIE